jgi:hypothetical protein
MYETKFGSSWLMNDAIYIAHTQAQAFYMLRGGNKSVSKAVGVDIRKLDAERVIEAYMRSKLRRVLDECNFHWAFMPPGDWWIDFFRYNDAGLTAEHFLCAQGKRQITGDEAFWAGQLYGECHIQFCEWSYAIVEKLPLRVVVERFPLLHTVSVKYAAKAIFPSS